MSFLSALNTGLSIVGGIQGIAGAARANRRADQAVGEAARVNRRRAAASDKALSIAENYDPAAETAASVDFARGTTETAIRNALTGVVNDFKLGGGQPGGDTLFNVRGGQAINRASDPLAAFAAEQKSTETSRRLGMFRAALDMGGDLVGNYLALGETMKKNPSGAMSILSGAIQGIPGLSGDTKSKSSSRKGFDSVTFGGGSQIL